MVEAYFMYPYGRKLFDSRIEAEQYFEKEDIFTMFLIGKYESDDGDAIETYHWFYCCEYEVIASDPELFTRDYILHTTSEFSEAMQKRMEYDVIKHKTGGTKPISIYKKITCYKEAEEIERTSWVLIA